MRALAAPLLAATPLVAQVPRLPVMNNGVPRGILVAADVGFPNDAAGGGEEEDGRSHVSPADAEHVLPVKLLHLHVIFGEQPILGIVGSEIEQRFVGEWSGWHGKDSRDEQIKKECKKTSRLGPPIDLSLRR